MNICMNNINAASKRITGGIFCLAGVILFAARSIAGQTLDVLNVVDVGKRISIFQLFSLEKLNGLLLLAGCIACLAVGIRYLRRADKEEKPAIETDTNKT